MTYYSIESRHGNTLLSLRMSSKNICVTRFRAGPPVAGVKQLKPIGYWEVFPSKPAVPMMTKLELTQHIQSLTGDMHEQLIQEILDFKPKQGQEQTD